MGEIVVMVRDFIERSVYYEREKKRLSLHFPDINTITLIPGVSFTQDNVVEEDNGTYRVNFNSGKRLLCVYSSLEKDDYVYYRGPEKKHKQIPHEVSIFSEADDTTTKALYAVRNTQIDRPAIVKASSPRVAKEFGPIDEDDVVKVESVNLSDPDMILTEWGLVAHYQDEIVRHQIHEV